MYFSEKFFPIILKRHHCFLFKDCFVSGTIFSTAPCTGTCGKYLKPFSQSWHVKTSLIYGAEFLPSKMEVMGKILARGHSRVPVYSGHPKNIIGLLLVKSLLTVRPETDTPVSAVSIRRVPRVPSDMPLYDILNEFQKGSSHMAAVIKVQGKGKMTPATVEGQINEEDKSNVGDSQLTTPLLMKQKSESVVVDIDHHSNPSYINQTSSSKAPTNDLFSMDVEHEVIGIITLEDVFEELLQEEIVDETDEYVDVHKRIRVAAAAAASSMARCPSIRRLTALKGAGGQIKQGSTPRKSTEDENNITRFQGSSVEPLENKR